MSHMYYQVGSISSNVVPASYVRARIMAEANALPRDRPVIPVIEQFRGLDARDAFDPLRYPLVTAFDAAHYPGACVQRYRVAAERNAASAARYPLTGPRQAPTMLGAPGDDEDNDDVEVDFFENNDLVDFNNYYRRSIDTEWVLINEPIISSSKNDNDDLRILPFERIGTRIREKRDSTNFVEDAETESDYDGETE
ncbi:unnamed protein product [Adineta steineri]|uniref:Uncharacterized protein n=1 Tax=Adineta steineri TaxID=433720 RepID=A0A819H8Z9_9BILA|nr:unnamed protein product [Adineta steineri]CAF1447798.1 unnamed protein product [Adineta steineri]CAF3894264.1 unnamed protein product [Adineta steineri]CAF4044034.1 unnamed protein product [Adineta steineri]